MEKESPENLKLQLNLGKEEERERKYQRDPQVHLRGQDRPNLINLASDMVDYSVAAQTVQMLSPDDNKTCNYCSNYMSYSHLKESRRPRPLCKTQSKKTGNDPHSDARDLEQRQLRDLR